MIDEPTPPRPRLFSWRLPIILAITSVVFYVLWTRVADSEALLATISSGEPSLIALSVVLMAVAVTGSSFRMTFMLRAMGFEIPFRLAFRAVMATWPFALVAPSRLNELLKAVVLREHMPMASGAGAVLAERVVDVQNLCLMATVGGLLMGQWETAGFAAAGFVGVWTGGAALAMRPDFFVNLPVLRKKADKLRALVSGFEALRRDPRSFAGVEFFSLVVWGSAVAIIWVLLKAFGADVSLSVTAGLWPLAIFVGLLPLTLSGMGTRDAAFLSLLGVSSVAVSDELVLSATIVYAVVTTILPAIAGIPWMIGELGNFRQAWK